ncbi:MAG: histidine ammonia-lyase [Chloroflexota bacterium]
MDQVVLDGENLTLEQVTAVAYRHDLQVVISEDAREKVRRAAEAVQTLLDRGEITYGITTGFGAFKDKRIPLDQVEQLQRNIIMSHAVGVGPILDVPTTRAMMLIRANTLVKGHSGIREQTVDLLIEMLNHRVHPVVPSQGSLGASGDLAPLAHMALPMIGLGEALFKGEILPGAKALECAGLETVALAAKEGLALTNGTSLMAAIGTLATCRAEILAATADISGALTVEALHGTAKAFDDRIHALRPHPRQVECARYMRSLLEGSQFTRTDDPSHVQDAYTLRCIPQVHGAVRDAIAYARWVLDIELNAATDNPLIFIDKDTGEIDVISGGNFHGEPIAIAMDYLALALVELGNISERRLTRLTDEASNQETLPAFLIGEGGLNSGFMLVQYTAAALASENKVLAHPASVDTIPSSANIEDHVSMGTIAARQANQICDNVERIIAMELFSSAQGIDFRRRILGEDKLLGTGTAPVYNLIRSEVPFIESDTVMYPFIEQVRNMVANGQLVDLVRTTMSDARESDDGG